MVFCCLTVDGREEKRTINLTTKTEAKVKAQIIAPTSNNFFFVSLKSDGSSLLSDFVVTHTLTTRQATDF
jgi:hypothetical protein